MPIAKVPSPSALNRYSAKQFHQPVNFSCDAPDAHAVYLCGDFNDWDTEAHPMKRQTDGTWQSEVHLNTGEHHYWFQVDGKPVLDPRADRRDHDLQDHKVSLLMVA